MEWKDKQVKGQIDFFLARWGRGKRHLPSNPKPAERVKKKEVQPKPMKKAKVLKQVQAFPLEELWGRPKGNPAKPLSNGYNFGAWLHKRGFKVLGYGAYSTIYAKEGSDRVLKVTAGRQDNWIDYIQWAAKEGYCGNLAPRVYSWKKYKTECGEFSVSVVERMKETINNAAKSDEYLIQTLLYPALSGHLLAQCYLEEIRPGSLEFFTKLHKTFRASDLYGKNMMLRNDGSFCVTDPVCGRSEVKINRLRSRDLTSLAPAIRNYFIESSY